MAFDIHHKFPLDISPKGIGINIPFNNSNVFQTNYKTSDALKMNIINYFLTNPGERYDNPEFGGGLRKFLFEQLSGNNKDLETLHDDIQQKFTDNFPGVILNDIEIITNKNENNSLLIKIKYNIPNTDIKDNIELNFN